MNGISPRSARRRTTMPGGAAVAAPAETFFILTEDGDRILIETGDKFLQEAAP